MRLPSIHTDYQCGRDLIARISRRKALAAIFIVFLIPIYWIAIRAPATGIYHDDGIYLVTAKAIAEGKGYRIISLPDERPQTKYPILFPGLLAVAWKVFPRFPDNTVLLKTIPFLSTILWLWFSYKMIREETEAPNVALWIVLLTAASPWVVFMSATLMSETLFACLCTWALFWLKRLEGQENDVGIDKALLISSGFTAAAFLTRTAGAPLIAAGVASMLLRKKYKTGVLLFVSCAILVAPWFLWQATQVASNPAIDSYYSISSYKNWNILFKYTADQKIRVLFLNFLYIILIPTSLFCINININTIFLPLAVSCTICLGFIRCARNNVGSIHIFLLLYTGMALIWVWPPQRFYIPILPFLLLYGYKGFSWICGRMIKSGTIQALASILLTVLLGSQMVYALLSSTGETLKRQTVSLIPSKYQQDTWMDVNDLLEWVHRNTSPESVLLGNLDPTYYLYTGRKAVRGFEADPYLLYYSKTPETALGTVPDLVHRIVVNRVNYIIQTPSANFGESVIFKKLLDRLIIEYPGALHLVKEGRDPSYKIYLVDLGWLLHFLEYRPIKQQIP